MNDSRVVRWAVAITLVAVLGGGPTVGCPAHAWEGPAHTMITSQARSVLPELLQNALKEHRDELANGVLEPDYFRIESHKLPLYHIRGATITNPGRADAALDRFAKQAEKLIKDGEPLDKIAFVLGQAAHFIQDLNVPLHVVVGETRDEHARYERQAYFTDWPGTRYGYGGFLLVKDYQCFAYDTAKRSKKYVDDALKPDASREVIETTWNDAVNDTANLWQSIFYKALGPEKAKELYGIQAPRKEIGKGFFC